MGPAPAAGPAADEPPDGPPMGVLDRLAAGLEGDDSEVARQTRVEELIAAHHPGVPLRAPIPGRRVPIDTGAAERLLGFRPAYSVPS